MSQLHLRWYESGSNYYPLFKSFIESTLDFDPNDILHGVGSIPLTIGQSRILLKVRSVPPTTGRSVSGIFSEGFRLWIGSGPPACCLVFIIFF